MAIRVQRHANVSKQATLLDGLDVSLLKWRLCGCDLNRVVHEGMNNISNVKIHLKTRNRNVNIGAYLLFAWWFAMLHALVFLVFFFFQKNLTGILLVSNGLDPDQNRRFINPNLVPYRLKSLSAERKELNMLKDDD